MEKIKQAHEAASEAVEQDIQNETELRALEELELVLVGGGSDGAPFWP